MLTNDFALRQIRKRISVIASRCTFFLINITSFTATFCRIIQRKNGWIRIHDLSCRMCFFYYGKLGVHYPLCTNNDSQCVKMVIVGLSIKFNYIDNEFSYSASWCQRWVLSSESRLFLPLSDYQLCRFRWFSSCRDLQWNRYEWRWHDCKYLHKLSVASSTSHIQLSIISVSQLSGPLEALMTLLIPQSSSEVDEVRK